MATDVGETGSIGAKICSCFDVYKINGRQSRRSDKSLYNSLFPNSSINAINRYEKGRRGCRRNSETWTICLNGKLFIAMDSSMPHAFSFDEGMSIVVGCDTQEEIDHYWKSLTSNGGQESMCGWLKDKYGVSWQIVPSMLGKTHQ